MSLVAMAEVALTQQQKDAILAKQNTYRQAIANDILANGNVGTNTRVTDMNCLVSIFDLFLR